MRHRKKSLSLNLQVDQIIRMAESSILLREETADYSDTVNRMIIGFFFRAIQSRIPDEEVLRRMEEILYQDKPIPQTEFEQFKAFLDKTQRKLYKTRPLLATQ